ncbi:MAG: tetraacyldisaccharide 4'-kinase [Nitrosomonadales bacterium]|nr:tetraacyldisaccharide 4'-kinase [Nitrosomonadales bacterium]
MHWLQKHWYRITPLHLILLPVSLVFRALVALRRALYRNGMLGSERLLLPVVVVGNISVGGTGKTPLTLALALQLTGRGWHPLIVSRGYGGTSTQPRQVAADSAAQQVGDEPLLMARRDICPVWTGRDRIATAHAAMQAHPQCDVILCDDGLQHYRLQRDVEIAVVDGARGFGNGWLLPAGPLREPVARLQTVDAVVVNGGDPAPQQSAMTLAGEVFYNLADPARTATAADFHASRNHAVAGIGNPQRYFRHLENLGIAFTAHAFPDHHPYSAADLAFTDCDAVLMTEKDAVKCAAFADTRFWALRVDARIDTALLDHILRKIEPHGRQTA